MRWTLIEVYCALRVAPEEIFGVGEREAGRRSRYAMMSTLLAAQEAANVEVERPEEKPPRVGVQPGSGLRLRAVPVPTL